MSFLAPSKNSWAFRRSWSIIYWLPTGIFLSSYFFHVKTVSGRSMQPTLNPDNSRWKDVVLFSKFAVHTTQEYGRDDIVTLRSPEDPRRILIKRIIAMEGDTVKTLPPYPDQEVKIPPGYVWIEGDEHFVSDDSNRFGPVSQSLIESKLVMVVWPPDRFGAAGRRTDYRPPRNAREERHISDAVKREQARHSRVRVPTTL
ncbi:peptidase S24/S26A/S26B/S26C [Gymnopilus junonius]|uniref:Mitochondrial inner membrane protease subunit n=1 Tax=Gymnopilus junonius TaxID=109634 RepID=A0A9P5P3P4_GYMJU|nr:peptidase S24/S26A/S26B/S26C [Gymnopilus junonius]